MIKCSAVNFTDKKGKMTHELVVDMYMYMLFPYMYIYVWSSLLSVVLMENDIRLTLGSGDRYYLGFTLKGGCVVEVHVCRGDQYVTICADTWSNIEASCQQPGYPPYGNRK